jgi:hypothetical protein
MSANPAWKKCVSGTKTEEDKDRSVYKHAEIIEKIVQLKHEKQGSPPSNSGAGGEVDQLCLMQAFHGVILSLACDISVFSEHYDVPEDVLMAIVADWLVSKHMGVEMLPIESFGSY